MKISKWGGRSLFAGCPLAVALLFMSTAAAQDWQAILAQRLPEYGHRNWIVVADSAYPLQSREGIETVVSNAGQLRVLHSVMAALDASHHVTPIVYTDAELKFVDESAAPGVSKYRSELSAMLQRRPVHELPHEQIISKLDDTAKTFRILIIKTNMTIPYTSVFLQLDCAYWGPDAERKLRETMSQAGIR